mmetsp:Transcript_5213/g.5771  ORF Transcript_5213/g.5771 Transcript_5213/m.5771 type:complete len:1107 (-) Transcript_5213:195-3515(-)
MVRFSNFAVVIMIVGTTRTSVNSFQTNKNHNKHHQLSAQEERKIPKSRRRSIDAITRRRKTTTTISQGSSSLLLSSMAGDGDLDPLYVAGEALSSATNAAVDSIFNVITDELDIDAINIARKQELVQQRQTARTYKVTLPLAASSTTMTTPRRSLLSTSSSSSCSASVLSLGITLCQISKGRNLDSVFELNLDTLDLEDGTKRTNATSNISGNNYDESIMDTSTICRRIDGEFQGVVVSSVKQGSASWVAGVRPGDILTKTSATLGNQMWPKSTLSGVKSVLLSRKAVAESVQFEFQRLGETVDNQYELTLTRPIGLNLKETEDGYVEITGFTPKASKLVRYAVKVSDRIIAVDSSLGDRMWPVSTVEGVISAVTARLPGQRITFRFERSNTIKINENEEIPVASAIVDLSRSNNVVSNVDNTATTSNAGVGAKTINQELLNRCQEILKRYKNDEEYVNKFSLPGVVADKVVYALASAETQVDSVTLSMILTAYLSCKQPKVAIRVFEAAIGVRADGTNEKVENTLSTSPSDPLMGKNGKQILQNIDALDVYTVSALLKAHAMNGDLLAVQTVLSALEGRGGTEMNGIKVASWPGTGPDGSLQPDNLCYNIAISAAGNSKTDEGLELALKFFNTLHNSVKNNKYENKNIRRMNKDVVSYNSIIEALAKYGEFEEAIETFYEMKKAGIKPDKYTFTALAKSVIMDDDNDVEELLYEMREEGANFDVKTFNIIIRYLCQQKKMSAAKKVVSWMEASGIHPDSWTYGFLMNGLLQNGNPNGALTLFKSACSDKRTVGLTENVYLYTTAMTSAAAIGDHTRALELLSRMNTLGIKPNIKTMTALLSACLSAEEPELAVDIFRRIPNPDSYAVMKGLLALSQAGKVDEALIMLSEKDTVAGSIQGKMLNKVYESLFQNSMELNDFMLARRVQQSLLGKGNIPSKAIFHTMFENMSLTFPKDLVSHISYTSGGLLKRKSLDEQDCEKFKFLLFLVDSLSGRNLPCEAPLYSTILSFGHHLGGLPRKISALMVSAKAHSGLYGDQNMKLIDDGCETACIIVGWEDLYKSYDELRSEIDGPSSLPDLHVRISGRELSRVLYAEKEFSYRKRSLV